MVTVDDVIVTSHCVGVGDGMLQGVVDHEIPQLEAACKAFDMAYTPKITFIVVKKRIHTRLVKSIGGIHCMSSID